MTRDPIDPNADTVTSVIRNPGELASLLSFPLLKQGDARWREHRLGIAPPSGRSFTIWGEGCLLTAMEMARAYLMRLPPIALNVVNDMLVLKGCFQGPLLLVEKAGHAMGMVALDSHRLRATTKDRVRVVESIKHVFDEAKEVDGRNVQLAILHVDKDDGTPKGDIYGEHFVVAFKRQGDTLLCGDPANGELVEIDAGTATGTSRWISHDGSIVEKHYTVVGVIPVFV